jgi:hypothetical protein
VQVTGIRVRYYQYTMKRPIGDVNGPLGNEQGSSALTFVDTERASPASPWAATGRSGTSST